MSISRFLKITLAVVFLLFCAGTFAVVHAGFASVQVRTDDGEGNVNLSIPVPMALAHLGVTFLPEEELREIRAEAGPHGHLIVAAVRELASAADGVLVEVRDGEEQVWIAKEGGDLIVHVRSREEEVRVSVPLRSAASLIERVLGSGPQTELQYL